MDDDGLAMTDPSATWRGRVHRSTVARGSKSEHTGVVLQTADGQTVTLRRAGENPFTDPGLEPWVGQTVQIEGRLHRGSLFIDSIRALGDDGDGVEAHPPSRDTPVALDELAGPHLGIGEDVGDVADGDGGRRGEERE